MGSNSQGYCIAICASALTFIGCSRIQVAPKCPSTLREGQSATLDAQESDEGAIATFRWEVIPGSAATIQNSSSARATLTAQTAGEAIIRLTASDGLYQIIAECSLRIDPIGVRVGLTASPEAPRTDDEVTLTCQSVGNPAAVAFSIEQIGGEPVPLQDLGGGLAVFSAATGGQYHFRCVGTGASGEGSEPVTLTVVVSDEPDRNGGVR